MKGNRQEHLTNTISKHLAAVLTRLNNKKIGFVCLNELTISPDLENATAYVSFLGAKYPKQNLEELNKSAGFIRSELAKELSTYKVPKVKFILDDLFDKALHMDKLIKG